MPRTDAARRTSMNGVDGAPYLGAYDTWSECGYTQQSWPALKTVGGGDMIRPRLRHNDAAHAVVYCRGLDDRGKT